MTLADRLTRPLRSPVSYQHALKRVVVQLSSCAAHEAGALAVPVHLRGMHRPSSRCASSKDAALRVLISAGESIGYPPT